MMDADSAVIEGDLLVTSGIGMYPAGISIGKVTGIEWNNDTLLKTVHIEPSAYFKNLQKVTAIVPIESADAGTGEAIPQESGEAAAEAGLDAGAGAGAGEN